MNTQYRYIRLWVKITLLNGILVILCSVPVYAQTSGADELAVDGDTRLIFTKASHLDREASVPAGTVGSA